MKTIIENTTKESKYLLDDDVIVVMSESHITVGQPAIFIIGDLNNANATLIENVTPPEDWMGCKYLFENDVWTINPNWTDPNVKFENS